MRVIFLGKKPSAAEALIHLKEKGVDITLVVAPENERKLHWEPKLTDVAKDFKIPVATEKELYQCIADPKHAPREDLEGCTDNIDVVFSFLFWNKIRKSLLDLPKLGAINFHPAPLPELRGVGGYNVALYEKMKKYGVSAHFIAEKIDEGDIIYVDHFPIVHETETVHSLEQTSQKHLLELFKKVVGEILKGEELPRQKQGKGRYFSRQDFEKLRRVMPEDSQEIVDRKVRAFWYPPYPGASVKIKDKEFTVVHDDIIKNVGKMMHSSSVANKKGFVSEKAYAESVANLTLKYVDILLAIKPKKGPLKFVTGRRKENPGRGMVWLAGGRSKHFMSYEERAMELVKEDYGVKPDKISYVGSARLFWQTSRFEAKKDGVKTDGDIAIFVAEIQPDKKLKTGRCFTEIKIMSEKEARAENDYVAFAVDCYDYKKKNGTPNPFPKLFKF